MKATKYLNYNIIIVPTIFLHEKSLFKHIIILCIVMIAHFQKLNEVQININIRYTAI